MRSDEGDVEQRNDLRGKERAERRFPRHGFLPSEPRRVHLSRGSRSRERRSRDAGLCPGARVRPRPLAHIDTLRQTSKKLNHWVGYCPTTFSRLRTHAHAASSSLPRRTTIGSTTFTV